MDFPKYIYQLLFEHDCVIIPGFGGLIGNYAPARIQTVRHEFFPPHKSLLFNPNLKQNDGLLAVSISLGEKITYGDALVVIQSEVTKWNRELNAGLMVEIGGVGRIFRDQEGNYQFIQNIEENFLADSYGLSSFVSPVISRRDQHVIETEPPIQIPEVKEDHLYSIPKMLKWAAFLSLPLGIAALLGISHFDKIRTFSVAYSGMLFAVPSIETPKPEPPSGFLNQPITSAEKPVAFQKEEAKQIPVPANDDFQKPYMIIVGAFRFLENAESLIADLKGKGYEASMAGQTRTGLYRVSLFSSADRSEAIRQLDIVRTGEFSKAWLLVK